MNTWWHDQHIPTWEKWENTEVGWPGRPGWKHWRPYMFIHVHDNLAPMFFGFDILWRWLRRCYRVASTLLPEQCPAMNKQPCSGCLQRSVVYCQFKRKPWMMTGRSSELLQTTHKHHGICTRTNRVDAMTSLSEGRDAFQCSKARLIPDHWRFPLELLWPPTSCLLQRSDSLAFAITWSHLQLSHVNAKVNMSHADASSQFKSCQCCSISSQEARCTRLPRLPLRPKSHFPWMWREACP